LAGSEDCCAILYYNFRNALGREEGGSGVPLDKAKYNEAVEYWEKNASLV
jgi:hypothetical protein